MSEVKLEANLTCPFCQFKQKVRMPTAGCQYMYQCQKCGKIITAKEGDCCVFCSFADTKCPPKQQEQSAKM